MKSNFEYLFGLSGYARSGKDTLGAVLVRDHGFKRVAFADALKEEASQILGVTVEEIEQDKHRFRGFLQWWGTEWRRGQDKEYWLKRFRERAAAAGPRVVVTDVRFENEADEIESLGGKLIRVTRAGIEAANGHVSETALDQRSALIVPNDGTLSDLAEYAGMLLWPEIEQANFFPSRR
jgi:hypothetical protein